MQCYDDVITSKGFLSDLAALNSVIAQSLTDAGLPVIMNGNVCYSDKDEDFDRGTLSSVMEPKRRALVAIAQLVIGITLGLRFRGIAALRLARFLGLSALSVMGMMLLGLVIASLVSLTGIAPTSIMFLSLSPGGLVEMGLIALSLNASPIFVTAHHLVRIVSTVTLGVVGWKRFGAPLMRQV